MSKNQLDFEKPIAVLQEQLDKAKQIAEKGKVDTTNLIIELEQKIVETKTQLYANLTPWQRVQLSRHPDRPYALDYIQALTNGDFIEQFGDRTVKDDKAMIGGFGSINGQTLMFIGQQKGNTTKQRQYRNFGMPNPEGYRKALRLMKLAEKFGKPIITLIDTPGAYPGLEAEERGQGEAIARNLLEMAVLKVPVICIIIGEGASGGALGIGIGDKVLMLENTWYSVISPESCSSILWRNWDNKERAADALKLTATDMLTQHLIDGIIAEPLGGAHANRDEIFNTVKEEILQNLSLLKAINIDNLVEQRIAKFSSMGVYNEA
ncbi:MAG: acetyl-CoA carboxylase carboxyltransferase subunit alpha [Bacteroidia bacterium]|nr:acetyl-CoA carboxylase carboxyltransferase subunit alpha [Bacteroidia bacterium]HQV00707.1 acetyl-CoA carboxylase carboxyltransferase subunit alpha [Bacteroidia bacterium]